MKYLVLRKNAIRRGHPTNQLSSSCFPIEVEVVDYNNITLEGIVRKAFDQINEGYVGMHEYIVVPMFEARVVSFRPKPQPEYEVYISNYDC